MIFRADIHEHQHVLKLIKQSIPDIMTQNINSEGYADYAWCFPTYGPEQVERKTVGEILSDMNGVEDQLRRQLVAHPEYKLWLLVEGIAMPVGVQLHVIEPIPTSSTYETTRIYKTPYVRFEAFLTSLERAGIQVKRTMNMDATAITLVQMFKSAQHESDILQRHLKPKIEFHPNPQVMTLLGAYQSGVGIKTAEKLIGFYTTVHNLMLAPPEHIANSIPGMGVESARKLHRAFGRTN